MQANGEQKRAVLPLLGYYLTFIHYFGFSIDPNDDTKSRYLSIRLKRRPRSAALAPSSPMSPSSSSSSSSSPSSSPPPLERRQQASSSSNGQHENPKLASYRVSVQRTWSSATTLLVNHLRSLVKFVAISFTLFIALNHCIVLVDYIYQGSKAFIELMLEIRLVITKFSALIFVLSWHWNQAKVRRLIRLVKSTSIYILSSSREHPAIDQRKERRKQQQQRQGQPCQAAGSPRWRLARRANGQHLARSRSACEEQAEQQRRACDNKEQEEEEEIGDSLSMDTSSIDRRIVSWWLMCISVTMIHFSLSEVELTKSYHLWQWLDDYSLHQLNNRTVSNSTLMFLASFDNYIYTVHVYGTRLIGASIICIVCSLQRDNVECLKLKTLQLVRGSAQFGTTSMEPVERQNQWQHERSLHALPLDMLLVNNRARGQQISCQPTGIVAPSSSLPPPPPLSSLQEHYESNANANSHHPIDPGMFFILGESNWLEVVENVRKLCSAGYLSSYFSLTKRSVQGLLSKCMQIIKSFPVCSRKAPGVQTETALISHRNPNSVWPDLGPQGAFGGEQPATPTGRAITTLDEITLSLMINGGLVGAQTIPPTPIGQVHAIHGGHEARFAPKSRTLPDSSQSSSPMQGLGSAPNWSATAANIEQQLERLASKYELIRTVNARIDSCFGPMLLIQFSSLFLMSCIDVVYFSISFNPNTKTKYIIISGMILLWWPYLLLYKFASDIGSSSKELLVSVRRLARLALVNHHLGGREPRSERSSPWPPKYSALCQKRAFAPQLFAIFGQNKLSGAQGRYWPNSPNARSKTIMINKLEHVFKPTNLSIMGIMTVDKFFLLNFAKIVITASVMIIQFVSY